MDAKLVDDEKLIYEAPVGVVREVFDGSVLMEDDLVQFDADNPARFRVRFLPVRKVSCLVFLDGPAVAEDRRD